MKLAYLLDRKGMYIYPWYISDLTSTADLKEIAGVNFAKMFVTIEDDFLTMYYDAASGDEAGRNLFKRIQSDPAFFDTVVANIYRYGDELLAFCREKTAGDLSTRSDAELLAIYEEYIGRLRLLRTWGWVPVLLDGLAGESFLSERLVKDFNAYAKSIGEEERASEYYSLLSSSEKESEVQRENIARLELAEIIQRHPESADIVEHLKIGVSDALVEKYPDIAALLTKHMEKFGSLTYAYSGPPMSVEHLTKALMADLEKSDISGDLAAIHAHYANIGNEKKRLVEKLRLPEDLQYLFRVSSELMYMKDWRKGAYQESYLLMDAVLTELGKRLGFSLKEMKYLILPEVKEAFLYGKRDEYAKRLKERLHRCCYVAEAGAITIYEGAKCDELRDELVEPKKKEEQDMNVTELKGMTAYAGKVVGTVKIVLTTEDIGKVEEGDILVSSATNPDLMLAMKKAGAFVTDSGGVISHAAIVAREMKKPCVVGTRIATHVLKDGDRVEVDANAGIVRKL